MMFEKVVIMLVLLIPEWKKVRTKFTLNYFHETWSFFHYVIPLDLKYLNAYVNAHE